MLVIRLIIHAYLGAALTVVLMWDHGLLYAALAAPFGASVFAALMASVDLMTGVYSARSASSKVSAAGSSPERGSE